MSTTTIALKDANGVAFTQAAEAVAGVITPHMVQEINGVPVSNANPLPVATTGSVSITNLPATQQVAGSVSVANLPATQAISGAVSFVSPQAITDTATAALLAAATGAGLKTITASGLGADNSVAQPAVGNVLATFTVGNAGQYFVQNQSAATLAVVFDDGNATAGTVSTQLLAPGAAAGQQGADTTPPMAWFVGRIRVTGPANSQFLARHN